MGTANREWPWASEEPPLARSLSRTVAANGAVQVRVDPPFFDDAGRPSIWLGRGDVRLWDLMGQLGYSCIEEIPLGADYRVDHCQRCGALGVEEHHIAPRALFGAEADEYPTVQLCVKCHRAWHEKILYGFGPTSQPNTT